MGIIGLLIGIVFWYFMSTLTDSIFFKVVCCLLMAALGIVLVVRLNKQLMQKDRHDSNEEK